MARYWFKQKRFGFGASPASWEGWSLTAAFVAIIVLAAAWFAGAPQTRAAGFFTITFIVTLAFIAISWRTTEGGWRWRWGDD